MSEREALAEAVWMTEAPREVTEDLWGDLWRQMDATLLPKRSYFERADRLLASPALARLLADAERRGAARVAAGRVSRSEIERALKAADAPEDSMATEEDLIRYEGRAEAVEIMRDMLRAALAAGAAERVRAENPERGPRCSECRLGLGVHEPRDPQCTQNGASA